ncbi:exosortase system-associated protein, TIGR04073 family [Nitrosomonas ureae]|uniref:Putative exosortase-associated protein, TIGR04073 family n=1 Tax=Nitrosomonas ureae TaxID=44577 RepID=A0A1H5WGP9_9PROT|nr:exosortase system-associated protein, TIGR04073 family [Nitrosomonas ureae]SEF98456.1 putative exosortase-associated protein, TIGR04073 family [Nitrosomonas ureae]
MRIIKQLVLGMLLCFIFSSQVQAMEEISSRVYVKRAGTKIVSGIANVATGWMELPKNINLWSQRDSNAVIGAAEGLLWGIFHTAGRTGSGALDLATFWLPTYPTPDPLFVWEDFSKDSDYIGWRMAR